MFIRRKKMPGNRIKIQIVKSVRIGDKVRQRVLRHVGTAHNENETALLEGVAQSIMQELMDEGRGQQTLFNTGQWSDLVERSRGGKDNPVPEGVRLVHCREEGRAMLGFRDVFGIMYQRLGWNNLVGSSRPGSNRMIREMVMARIARPRSKRRTTEDLSDQSAVSLNLDSVYRSMDHIDGERIAGICAQSLKMATTLLPGPMTALFYDATTLSFASEQEDGLRMKGFSKDGRHHRVQVLLALLITPEGLPVGYEVFPGNTSEGKTLLVALDSLMQRFPGITFTLVADAAMISKDNEEALQERNIPYVLGARIRKLQAGLKEQVLDAKGYSSWGNAGGCETLARYRIIDAGKERQLIATYSPVRASKDVRDRNRKLEKLAKRLDKSSRSGSMASGGNARYLSFPDGKVVISGDKIAEQARWDGLRGIMAWNCSGRDARELVVQYRQLAEIEACFRANKHDLRIRPVFHWKERRVRAHLAICYMAFCCLQHLRHLLAVRGHRMSPERIRRALEGLQVSILHDTRGEGTYGMPSPISRDARVIYQVLGMEWNMVPFTLSHGELGEGSGRNNVNDRS